MESDASRMCELLVGLPEVKVLGVEDVPGEPLVVHVEQAGARPWCHRCGGRSRVKDRARVVLADLACFGRRARLVWHKFRLCCADDDCEMGSWTWEDPRIAHPRQAMTNRAGRWATGPDGGRPCRSASSVAAWLRWHGNWAATGTPWLTRWSRMGPLWWTTPPASP